MARPTEDAINFFQAAAQNANFAILRMGTSPTTNELLAQKEMMQAIWALSIGLEHLSVGLRATYIKLEEVKASIKK